MARTIGLALLGLVSMVVYVGCSSSTGQPGAPGSQTKTPENKGQAVAAAPEHGHRPGGHGGLIAEIGRDKYHAETIFGKEGIVKIYTLGSDETRIQEVETQTLGAYAQADDAMEGTPFSLQSVRQPGDAEGKTSMFMGKLPEELWGKAVTLTVPITIKGERFRFRVTSKPAEHDDGPMTVKVSGDKEKELYLTPAGKYTKADIAANGNTTPSQKFEGIKSNHNTKPKTGDKICPISETKANPKFTWFVGGQPYQFCCPPCIDEFVQKAKEHPEEIEPQKTKP